MSEYQYYEFRAVDSPLTDQQQAELRSHSSRALITASSFINEYHWGDLKVVTAQRLEVERQKREAEETKRLAQRKQQLEHLAAHSDVAWATIDQTLQRGSGHAYDQAFNGVKELAEAMSLAKRQTEFQAGLEKLLVSHGKRSAWIKRLTQAGFKTGNQ